ncbi:MAG: hypothetical protein JNL08_02450 [Planctomycetes bacterium]|nr:hypothetical protein [Planctomycetota bacterium]
MPFALIALVLANAVPLAGALWFDWDRFEVFALYWSECAVVGGFTVLHLVSLRPPHRGWRPRDLATGLFHAAAFALHYGVFLFVHAILLCHLFGRGDGPGHDFTAARLLLQTALQSGGGLGLWALVASHGVAFANDRWRQPATTAERGAAMVRPYRRIVAMQLTLLAGGALSLAAGSHGVLLALLVAAKTLVDAVALRADQRRAAAAAARAAAAG